MLACSHGKGKIACELIEKHAMNQNSISDEVNLYLWCLCTSISTQCTYVTYHYIHTSYSFTECGAIGTMLYASAAIHYDCDLSGYLCVCL